jgi:hypothetical protein
MELYEDSFFAQELEIHWLSIMNSCVLVVLLTGTFVVSCCCCQSGVFVSPQDFWR